MKSLKLFLSVLAIIIGMSPLAKGAHRSFTPPPGYSLYTYDGGNYTVATSYSRVDPSTAFCPAASGKPCIMQGHANGGVGSHPKQADLNDLKAAIPFMNVPGHASNNDKIKLTIKVND